MTRHPLAWPAGWPKTEPGFRKGAKFSTKRYSTGGYTSVSVSEGVTRVLAELRALGVREGDSIISTNIPTRMDGLPRGDGRPTGSPGVAVYWQVGKAPMKVIAIDQYDTVADNLAAVAATLSAMRAIERHGGAKILERAFSGFDALPPPGASKHWRDLLDVPEDSGNKADQFARAKMHYRACASANHPDKGGDANKMAEYNRAWEQAQRELS